MTNVLSRTLPAPSNWQDFEHLCFDLYSRLWRTNDAEMHGRRGQPQAGVDVYGHDRVEGRFVGVQCKGKEEGYGGQLTDKELRAEVEKAKTFDPLLKVFIVATTALNDVTAQKLAREISNDHASRGLFEVRVQGWGTLRQRITDYPELLTKYFQDFAPYDVVSHIDAAVTATERQGEHTRAAIERESSQILSAINERFEAGDPLQTRIAEIAKLIDDGSPQAALRALQRLWTEEGAQASPRNRYRLRANIGSAFLALDDSAAAIREFRAAYAEDPSWPNARAILATAEVLEGDQVNAYGSARHALADDPTSHRAAAVLLDSAPSEMTLADIEAVIPESLRQRLDINLGFSIRAQKAGDLPSAEAYARRAYEMQPDDWRASSALAETLLAPLSSIEALSLTHRLPINLQPRFDQALDLLRRTWAQLISRDDAPRGKHVAANLVSALEIAGLNAEAEIVLDQALKVAPRYPPLLRRYAQSMVQADDWAAAAKALASIPEDEVEPPDRLLFVQSLIHTGDPEGALAAARKLQQELTDTRLGEVAATMQIEAAEKAGRMLEELDSILRAWPNSIMIRSVASSYLPENDVRREMLLKEIDGLVPGIDHPADRFHAAEALYGAKEFAKAADLYEGLHGVDKDALPLRRHLKALYFADRRRDARRLFESLADELKALPQYNEVGVAIYEHSGLLPEARALLERSLALNEDLHKRLEWLGICERLGDIGAVAAWLSTVTADQQGRPDELMTLALAIDRHLSDPKCLPIAYRALRGGYGDPQIHLAYTIGLFIMGHIGQGAVDTLDTIQSDSAVLLTEKDGNKRLTRIIETEPDLNIERDEIAPDSVLAQRLYGLKCGDEIEFENLGLDPTCYVVAEVRNKYLHAHFRSLQQFETLFPENRAFGSFTIDDNKGEDRFKPIFDSVKRRADFSRRLEDGYRTGSLPIAVIGKMSGSSAFDVWEAFRQHSDLGIRVAVGVPQEVEQSDILLRDRRQAVVDPLTLYGLVRLGVADRVRRSFESLSVVQTSIDALRKLLVERQEKKGRKQGTLGWDGEHYLMVELTDEMVGRQIADAIEVLTFAHSLTLVPAEAVGEIREEALPIFEELDRAYLDTVLAAQGDGRLLLCDDRPFRALAFATAGTQGVWSQAAIKFAAENRVISADDYMEVTGALAESGYVFTMVGPHNFLHELRKSGWTLTPRLNKIVELLTVPTNDLDSVKTLLRDLMLFGWRDKPNPEAFRGLFESILRSFRRAQPTLDLAALMSDALGRVQLTLRSRAHRRLLRKRLRDSSSMMPVAGILRTIERPADHIAEVMAQVLGDALARAQES